MIFYHRNNKSVLSQRPYVVSLNKLPCLPKLLKICFSGMLCEKRGKGMNIDGTPKAWLIFYVRNKMNLKTQLPYKWFLWINHLPFKSFEKIYFSVMLNEKRRRYMDATTLSLATLRIKKFSITTLSVMGVFATLCINDTLINDIHHNNTAIMLNVTITSVAFYLFLCWTSFCWVSLCWMSWRQYLHLVWAYCQYLTPCQEVFNLTEQTDFYKSNF